MEVNGQKLPLKSGMLIILHVPRGHGFLQGCTLSLTLQTGTGEDALGESPREATPAPCSHDSGGWQGGGTLGF